MLQVTVVGAGLSDDIGIVLLQAVNDRECAIRVQLTCDEVERYISSKEGARTLDTFQLVKVDGVKSDIVENNQIAYLTFFLHGSITTCRVLFARAQFIDGTTYMLVVGDALLLSVLAQVPMYMEECDYLAVARPLEQTDAKPSSIGESATDKARPRVPN